MDLHVGFSEKSEPWPEKCGTLLKKGDLDLLHMISKKIGPSCRIFWKKWTLAWKMWTFTSTWKSGPLPVKCGPLSMMFWKKCTLTWKCGPFIYNFLKNEDLDVGFSEKSGSGSEKCGPLSVIFWRKMNLYLINVDLCTWFSEKKVDFNLKTWTFYAWFSEKWGPFCVIF